MPASPPRSPAGWYDDAAARPPARKPKWLLIGGAALLGVILIAGVANAAGGRDWPDKANSAVEGQPTAEPVQVPTPTPTVEPTTMPPPTPAAVDAALFAPMARNDLDDFGKDLDDMVLALDEGGFFRLLTNSAELSINLGQLQAETAPTSIADEWAAQLTALAGSIDAMDAAISDGRNDDVRSAIDVAHGQVAGLRALTERVG